MAASTRISSGAGFDWAALPPLRNSLADVPRHAEALRFRREKASHRGISGITGLRRLWAYSVDPMFFEEICCMTGLEMLYVDGTTVADLSGLARISALRTLIIVGGTRVPDLEWAAGLHTLSTLAIENFKRVRSLDPLAGLTNLRTLGVEGSLWTPMRVESLAPIASLADLEYLFLTNLRTADGSLRALHGLARLRALECGRLFARGELERLRQAIPQAQCSWFDMLDKYGSLDAGMKALKSSLRGIDAGENKTSGKS